MNQGILAFHGPRCYPGVMPERSSKRPRDLNALARSIVDEATGEPKESEIEENEPVHLAAVALGRKGGRVGGKARAEKLSPERRSEIAKKASEARWAAERRRRDQD